ncbi:hypothetical protein MMC10_001126 [Thelotrema lepadinum]|nr:hypothetical protein [Thelotrema lepadinum]
MASGLEIAGLVLGAVPLLISACEHYAEGLEIIKGWWRFEREIDNIKRTLIAQKTIIDLTCERLLDGLVSAECITSLLDNAEGSEWEDKDLKSKLKHRLGKAYDSYIDHMVEIHSLVVKLSRLLDVDTGSLASPAASKGTHSQAGKQATSDPKKLKRIKFVFSQRQHKAILDQLDKKNDVVSTLVSKSLELEPLRIRRKQTSVSWKSVQKRARILHEAISTRLSCTCTEPHVAHLQLEEQGLAEYGTHPPSLEIKTGSNHDKSGPQFESPFEILFLQHEAKNPSNWLHLQVRIRFLPQQLDSTNGLSQFQGCTPSGKGTSQNGSLKDVHGKTRKRDMLGFTMLSKPEKRQSQANTSSKRAIAFAKDPEVNSSNGQLGPELTDLCALIKSLQCGPLEAEKYIGYMCCSQRQILSAHIATTSALASLSSDDIVPVSEMIARKSSSFTLGERYRLAVIIAHSVLQLSNTPWLPQTWKLEDILTVRKAINNRATKPSTSASIHPVDTCQFRGFYISKPFPPQQTNQNQSQSPYITLLRSPPLFFLGLALIELCLNKPISALRDPKLDRLDASGAPNLLTDWAAAKRLVDVVLKKAGSRYADAVRRCIHCDFDQREVSLENETFRRAVYEGVLGPLEEVWGDFKRG